MKITEEKHNHKLTNLLKVFIFSVLMIIPFLSVATRCLYVICNKNAYQSYNGSQKETSYINLENNTPQYDCYLSFGGILPLNNFSSTNNYFYVTNVEYISGNLTTTQQSNLSNSTSIRLWRDGNNFINYGDGNLSSAIYNFVFKCDISTYSTSTPNNNVLNSIFYRIIDTNSLDNVFEYSIDKLQEEQYLTWTQNTAVYQGVETMTTQLGITQTVIPMLIVYWFMLTIIYVIIDIVLALFTKLTHMIGNKTT